MGVVRSRKQKAKSGKCKAESRKQKGNTALSSKLSALCFKLCALCFLLCAFHPAVSQVLTFSEPEKLPSTINTPAEEGMPLLSPDGKTLYFTRSLYDGNVGGKYAGQDVWVSKWDGEKWGKAVNTIDGFSNNKNNNSVVGISSDGKTIYFLDASAHQKIKGIYFSKNINGKWTPAELIPIEGLSNDGFLGFYVSPDFQVILISMKGEDSRGEEDLYVSLKDASGKWGKPRNLGPSINTPGFEISPFLTADKKRLFFSSNGHPGFGDGDIFYAERLYDSWETWSKPNNLGQKINSKHFDAGFLLASDSVGWIASNRGGRNSDIFKVRISKGDALPSQESIDKMIEEAKSILSEIKGPDTKVTIVFDEDSYLLSEEAKTNLLRFVDSQSVFGESVQIQLQGFYHNQQEMTERNSLAQKRIDHIRRFLIQSGVTNKIIANLRMPTSKSESPDQVAVTTGVEQ